MKKNIKFKNLGKKRRIRFWNSVALLLFIMAIIFTIGRLSKLLELKDIHMNNLVNQSQEIKEKAKSLEFENEQMKARIAQIDAKTPKPTQEEIEAYVKTIFGRDGKVAIAVSHHECSPANGSYPACVALTDREYSIGLFQINLKNSTHVIHAAKVPGNSIEEKVEKLKDPFINTLIAYKIFKDSNGFHPWSAYKNLSYLKSM